MHKIYDNLQEFLQPFIMRLQLIILVNCVFTQNSSLFENHFLKIIKYTQFFIYLLIINAYFYYTNSIMSYIWQIISRIYYIECERNIINLCPYKQRRDLLYRQIPVHQPSYF
ncbi:hypothetical protein SS50377_27803 [Spironucleus salmonicida]|uniref:Transmembrane protein n=1 Tax=Spironucleus salmonicida TaxID=348837 RepID=A0A9P8LKH8_9EUKA|nr:hypothetical protein SS50377_27803 [Spironucleus salmonicida]